MTARANVSFRRVLPLEGLLDVPQAMESSAESKKQRLEVYGSSSESEETKPMSSASEPQEMEDAALQVRDWRFLELHTTDLAALREVDVCIPFRLFAFEDDYWKRLVAPPTVRWGLIMPAENGTTLLRCTGPLARGLPGRDILLSKVLIQPSGCPFVLKIA